MGKGRNKILTYEAQLRELGIELEKYKILYAKLNGERVENLGYNYVPLIDNIGFVQATNRYKWKNLPPNLTSDLIESMLYFKGAICLYVRGGTMYALPFVKDGNLSVYGRFTSITPIAFNGKEQKMNYKLNVNEDGVYDEKANAVILWDSQPMYNGAIIPKVVLLKQLNENCSKILNMCMQNIQNSNKKLVFQCEDETQATQLRRDLDDAFGSTDNYIVVNKGVMEDMKPIVLNNDVTLVSQSLFESWQSFNNIRCELCGIENNGAFEKKERVITSETRGDVIQSKLALMNGLEMRKLAIKQFISIYGGRYKELCKIDVELNECFKPQEEIMTRGDLNEQKDTNNRL